MMNNSEQVKRRKPRAHQPVTVIVEHEFVGDKTLVEAFIPVLVEDLRRKAEQPRTLDNDGDSP
jgi:hypothetical protein